MMVRVGVGMRELEVPHDFSLPWRSLAAIQERSGLIRASDVRQ